MATVNQSLHVIRTKSNKRISGKRNGRVKVSNIYDTIMTAEEFMRLPDEKKLIAIVEYKARHGLGNASLHMGQKEYWLYNQRLLALARLKEKGIDGHAIMNEHITKRMKFDKYAAPKKVRRSRK